MANNFQIFSKDGTNIIQNYASDSEILNGFQANTVISSSKVNSVLKQCSLVTYAIAQYIVSKSLGSTNNFSIEMTQTQINAETEAFFNKLYNWNTMLTTTDADHTDKFLLSQYDSGSSKWVVSSKKISEITWPNATNATNATTAANATNAANAANATHADSASTSDALTFNNLVEPHLVGALIKNGIYYEYGNIGFNSAEEQLFESKENTRRIILSGSDVQSRTIGNVTFYYYVFDLSEFDGLTNSFKTLVENSGGTLNNYSLNFTFVEEDNNSEDSTNIVANFTIQLGPFMGGYFNSSLTQAPYLSRGAVMEFSMIPSTSYRIWVLRNTKSDMTGTNTSGNNNGRYLCLYSTSKTYFFNDSSTCRIYCSLLQ